MGNWLNSKLYILPITVVTTIGLMSNKLPWGFYGHKKINRQAVFSLPPEIFPFYKEHLNYITEHAVDPDKRRYIVPTEGPCHFIDLDHYENPFDSIPHSWNKAITKFTEDSLRKHGIVPWHIYLTKLNLQKAFEEKNVEKILKYSADLGHYIGDAHVPLHTTHNYNGQFTNQKGIHGLWESRLVELYSEDYNYFVGKANYISNMQNEIWKVLKESHLALDSVFKFEAQITAQNEFPKYSFEQRGATTVRVYSREFSLEYHRRLNKMVERRLTSSIRMTASVWFTAWVDAGQPDLSSILNHKPSNDFIKEMEALEKKHTQHQHSGRDCD
jgi:hypothetical protein